jgi:NADH:ubiquinone oxidoreductase subunit K
MPGSALVLFFEVVSVVGSGLTALKIFSCGLHRRYRVLFAYLILRVPYITCSLFLNVNSPVYQKLFIITEPLFWAFYILLVRELYGLVLERHRGVYTLGRWVMYLATAVSVTVSLLSLLPRITPAMPQRSRIMGYIYATERGVDFSLAIFILLILFFLSRYPVLLSRNVLVHAVVYSIFFLSNTLGLVLHSVFGLHLKTEVDMLFMGTASACVVAWLVLLNARGEEVRLIAPHFGRGDEQRILLQLDSLNSTLLRIYQK